MFQIDRSANRLRKLERATFSELGFREREHLQEWLASMPEALCEAMSEGEDGLLIIQKEFDGFDGTRERLDLLALDRSGQLVVIENKLDDSGRDVVWQALKYAAYCSSLKKAEIVGIFQQFLERQGGGDAAGAICEFLGEDALDEVVLNDGTNQRIIFIAANFRREVTATVLWLREHQIDARCIKVVPYKFGEELFIDLQQVIPTPEAADYMIRMAEKDSEEKSAQGVQRKTHQMRMEYWTAVLEALREAGARLYENISPGKDHWLSAGVGISGCHHALILLKSEIRVELSLQSSDAEKNKWLFDRLHARKDEIEKSFGDEITWLRLNDKKASRLQYGKSADCYDRDNWPELVRWHVEMIQKWESALRQPLAEVAREFRESGGTA